MRWAKRVFVVAWEYPPILSGESIVCHRTLQNSRFDYDVCCGPVKTSEDAHIHLFPLSGNKYFSWPFAAAHLFEKLYSKEKYRVMMSRAMPPNGHLAGWLIKKRHPEVKWIAYFSDPIWNSPFLKLTMKNDHSHRPNWAIMKVFGLPCKWALKEANALMFNNDRLARYVLGCDYDQYREKILIAPYGHDGIRSRPMANCNATVLRLTHVGQIYGNRTFETLVSGMSLLKERHPNVYSRLVFRQVGFVCEAERRRVEQSSVAGAFTFVDQVPYHASIEEMYQSDWLLIIDPVFDSEEKNIYIPGKLFDYLSTGRPICCIAEHNSATGDVTEIIGCPRADPTAEAVCAMLLSLFSRSDVNLEEYKRLHCRGGIEQLDKKIAELQGISI